MGASLSFMSLFVGVIGTSLMAAGIYDAFILPMMPFMHFTSAVMGILILVVEGVLAAPRWAFSHVRMDGDSLFDQTQLAGYKILFNLLFRMPLILFGLLLSLLVFDAMIWLLSHTLWLAMVAATADNMFGFLVTIDYVVLITGMNYGSSATVCWGMMCPRLQLTSIGKGAQWARGFSGHVRLTGADGARKTRSLP
jgi:conjugal transfer/type IV secretion protein DotA/TraY